MQYKVINKIVQNKDWIICDLEEGATNGQALQYSDVSINRNDKKTGQIAFPNFDEIKVGGIVEGNVWESPSHKWYLFPPKEKKSGGGAYRAPQKQDIAEAQQNKAKNIAEAQDRSAWMWAKTNATSIVTSSNLRDAEVSSADEMVDKMIALATRIYNAEPHAPF